MCTFYLTGNECNNLQTADREMGKKLNPSLGDIKSQPLLWDGSAMREYINVDKQYATAGYKKW
jgi:hypothetical protein